MSLDQKRCPTLQKIRLEKLSKENRELKDEVSNWKFRYCVLGAIFIFHIVMDIIRDGWI